MMLMLASCKSVWMMKFLGYTAIALQKNFFSCWNVEGAQCILLKGKNLLCVI